MTATAAPPRVSSRSRSPVMIGLAVAAAVVALALVTVLLRGPAMVDEITIANRSGAPVTVEVTRPGHHGVLPLGTIDGGATFRYHAVLDQGDQWVFRLRVGPDAVGTVRQSRAALADHGWQVVVPGTVADRLAPDRR